MSPAAAQSPPCSLRIGLIEHSIDEETSSCQDWYNRLVTTVIYGLTDPETQALRYVGQTRRSLPKRLRDHINDRGRCRRTNWIKSLKTRGLKPDIFEIDSVPDDCANDTEKLWIGYYRYASANLTNGTEGGEGSRNPTPETRAKMSAAQRGRPSPNLGKKASDETRAKLSAALRGNHRTLGKKLSIEHRSKLSVANRGRKLSAEWRAKISSAKRGNRIWIGRKHSAETRVKMSAAQRGRKFSPEHCAKISIAKRGRHGQKHSAETRAKMSASIKATLRRKKGNPAQPPLL